MTSKHGEVFEFNTFIPTLGNSRLHTFIYSKNKTTEDFIRCTIDTLNSIGGSVNNITTDNMTTIVSITNGTKKKHPKIVQFEKDLGVRIHLCKVKSPETKGGGEPCIADLQQILQMVCSSCSFLSYQGSLFQKVEIPSSYKA